MAPRTWECAKCKHNILYNERKERVGADGFSSKLHYYARGTGGFWDYSPHDYFCKKCSSKVFSYCKNSGALEEIRGNKEQAQLESHSLEEQLEDQAIESQIIQLSDQAQTSDSDGNETRNEPVGEISEATEESAMDVGDSTRNHSEEMQDASHQNSQALTSEENMEVGDQSQSSDRNEVVSQDTNARSEANGELELSEGQEINSEAYSIDTNVEACYSEATFHSEPLTTNSRCRRSIANVRRNFPKIVSIPKSQKQCVICKGKTNQHRRVIPEVVRMKVWRTECIFIPKGCRSCHSHHEHGTFKPDALAVIRKKGTLGAQLDVEDTTNLIFYLTSQLEGKKAFVDFDDPETDQDLYMEYLGMEKVHFDHMYENYVEPEPKLLKSRNRSKRNALAIFLAKMRLGVSQKFLGRLFGIQSQSIVCTTIKRVAMVLNENFLPHAEGYQHISREQITASHQPEFVRKLFAVPEGNIALVLDATYLDINKSSDFDLQQKTYCIHKKKNLVKPMMVVAPDGYIICADGPYFSDGKHNDARMLSDMLDRPDSIRTLIKPGDHMLKDRGFRDVEDKLKQFGITFSAPEHLKKGQKQFSTEQANASRRVTVCRWVVEASNGRPKNVFPFFANRIPNAYLGRLPIPEHVKNHNLCQLGIMWKIVCGIINKYHPSLFVETEKHERILELLNSRAEMCNLMATKIAELDLQRRRNWDSICEAQLTDFPILTKEDMEDMTLGTYQLRNAQGYTDLIRRKTPNYRLEVCKEDPKLLLAKVPSRFRARIVHHAYVGFDSTRAGSSAITGYACTCQVGNINVSACSHVTAVVWYLAFERHQPTHKIKRRYAENLLSAAETSLRVENANFDEEDDIDVNRDEEDEEGFAFAPV